ncbi:porin [Variovorax sp. LT1R16]|uniref:porin n=1 Tax=Variovorax sp. LT1R16 TaxID=3443728 RepID=UPI003F46BC18
MKHTLVAIAALTAAAGAFAQSNVQLFGVLDASLAHIKAGNASITGLANGGQSSSRLGFRGVEDLGGGLAAGFWLEAGINVDNGNSAGFSFDRRSTVSLSTNELGELRLGRDKSPAYLNIETFDPFGDVGVGGIGGSNLVGSASSAVGTPEGSAPKRTSNGISYLLPATLGGFYGQVQYAFGEQVSNVINDTLRDSVALRLGYGSGPLNAALGYGETRGGTTAVGVDYKSANIGASYNFGVAKPMILFATERGNGRRVDLLGVGVTVPVGAGEIRAAYSHFQRKDIDNADSDKLALGYGYNLSKRTQLYGTISRVSNDDRANRGLAVSSSSLASPTIALGSNVSGYELGLRHSF